MHKILFGVALFGALILGGFLFASFQRQDTGPVACTMDAKICPDGSAVGRTGPKCEFETCPAIETPAETQDEFITIVTPQPESFISSPFSVSGMARGSWFFEASFPIDVVNWDGLIIGQGYAMATDDWMTNEFVPFAGEITYTLPEETAYNHGFLIFRKDNPSGLPEHDDAREFKIYFSDFEQLP